MESMENINELPQEESEPSSGTKLARSLEVAKNFETELIGSGFEKNVYQHPFEEGEVIKDWSKGSDKVSKVAMKRNFYLSKLMHIIYPEHYPDILLSLPNKKLEIHEKVKKGNNLIRRVFQKYPQQIKVRAEAASLGVSLDDKGSNFIFDENNNAVYVDSPMFGDAQKIREAIEEKLEGGEKEKALHFLNMFEKIDPLYQEEVVEYFRKKD